MKKSITYLLIFFGVLMISSRKSNAQNIGLLNDTIKNTISLDFNYLHNSTAFTNEFIKTYYLGKYISQDIKDNVKRKLNDMNLFGQELHTSLYGIIHFDSVLHSPNHNLYVGISSQSFFNLYFPKDLFKVVFYGNKDFLNDTAYFNHLRSTHYKYQSFDVGWLNQKNYKNLSLTSGIKVSLLKGQQFYDVGMINGYLYTDNLGSSIDLGAKAIVIQSDTTTPIYSGTGSAITFFTEIYVSEKSKIHIEFNDLGFITWNKNTLMQSGDTSFNFTGADIVELINGNSTSTSIDSISSNFLDKSSKEKTTTVLPARIFVCYQEKINEKWQYSLGMQQRLFFYYNMFFFGRVNYYFNKKITANIQVAYGGYGNLAVGTGIRAKLGKSWQVIMQSNNIEGLLLPKSFGGLSLQTGIIKQF